MIYLDYNATTPVDDRVLAEMLPLFTQTYANASSVDHGPGDVARALVEDARAKTAALVGARSNEVLFTSGATEANNMALLGVMARAPDDAELVVSAVDHPSVLEPARLFGKRLRIVSVDELGVLDLAALSAAITSRTALISVMAANNETGAIQPIAQIGQLATDAGVPFHVDATQAMGRIPVDVRQAQISLLSLSAHKMCGPKGVGALYVRRRPRIPMAPRSFGGGHERNLRAGTLNVPGIVGLGAAATLAAGEMAETSKREGQLRQLLLRELHARSPVEVIENVPSNVCLPQTLSARFTGVTARALLREVLGELALAAGSACSTTSVEPSHVLLAQGLSEREAAETLRFSFGRQTTEHELRAAVGVLVPALERLVEVRRAA